MANGNKFQRRRTQEPSKEEHGIPKKRIQRFGHVTDSLYPFYDIMICAANSDITSKDRLTHVNIAVFWAYVKLFNSKFIDFESSRAYYKLVAYNDWRTLEIVGHVLGEQDLAAFAFNEVTITGGVAGKNE